VVVCFALAAAIAGQQNLSRTPEKLNRQFVPVYGTKPGTGIILLTVFSERSTEYLHRTAFLKLSKPGDRSVNLLTRTDDDSRGVFSDLPYGTYTVEISAAGYLSAYQDVVITSSILTQYDILLHPDPAAVNLDIAERIPSGKARKESKRAITALKSRDLHEAQKHLDEAYREAPSSAEIKFLMGYWSFQNRDFEKASNYLTTATTLSSQDAQALTLLGRARLEREDYAGARAALERAVAADEKNWLSHDLLGDAYLHQREYAKARDEAQIAISQGKSSANPARLVLGQALINLGRDEDGMQALEGFR
jgi:Tfp pilus assembly protein PilF